MANNKKTNASNKQNYSKNHLPKIGVSVTAIINNDTNIKGYANAVIADSFAINDIAIVDSKNGLFASLPKRKYIDEHNTVKYREICSPITKEVRNALNETVLDAYNQKLEEIQGESNIEIIDDGESESTAESEETLEDLDESDGLVPTQ